MPEILLHYIWQKHLWSGFVQRTTDGKSLEIISVGVHNRDAGPDFSNAHIRIDGQDWVGNIELHIHSSDWYKHRHDQDKAYDSTILHVVCKADKVVESSEGREIAQCELCFAHGKDYLSGLLQQAQLMDNAYVTIECSQHLLADSSLMSKDWKRVLLQKRLECKRQSIEQILKITQGSWLHAFYISLAHSFGFHTNGIPFETLAIQTPLSCLQKHRNSLFQLTAILLGQSGLLQEEGGDDERRRLWREYCFLQKKFSLVAMDGSMWKKARMRPQGAPEVRIRQFAHLIYQSEFLFANLIDAQSIDEMVDCLRLRYGDDSVYSRVSRPQALGRKSIEILLINTVLPYRYAYGRERRSDVERVENDAIWWLGKIAKEDNTIIRQWQMLGQKVDSAADTQALIHLYQNYCQPHQCYHCHVGHQIFAHKQLELF